MTELALKTTGLTKQFGQRKAVDKVSFELPEGAFLSIFGPNGAGKTTLLRLLSTVARPTNGSAQVCSFDLKEEPDQIRQHIGLISHLPMVYPDLTALENLELFGKLYGVADPHKRAMELLEAVELKARRLDCAKTFSRGMTQRLSIARALINDPSLVFLDEPYSGLDPHAVDVLDQLIAKEREGRTFVMVSHDLSKGYQMCSHVMILAKGRVATFGTKEEIDAEKFGELCRTVVGAGGGENA